MIKYLPLLLLIASCRTTKEIDTNIQTDYKELTRIRDSAAQVITEQSEAYNRHIEELITSGITFEACPPSMNRDSVLQLLDSAGRTRYALIEARDKIKDLQNKVKINADGSIEAEGAIKSANVARSRTEDELRSLELRYNELQHYSDSLVASQKTTSEVTHKKKSTRWGLLPWGLLFLATGLWVYEKWKRRQDAAAFRKLLNANS